MSGKGVFHLNIGLFLAILIAIGGFYRFIVSSAENALRDHIQDSRIQHSEIRKDIGAVYQYMLTMKPQTRLEGANGPLSGDAGP